MAMLDPINSIEVKSDTAWPEESRYARTVVISGGTVSYDSGTKTLTVSMWGTPVITDDATYSPTAAQVNSGLFIMAGRDGAQTIALPTSGISDGVAVMIVGYDSNISGTNEVEVTGPATPGSITAVDQVLGYVWAHDRWVAS